MQCSISYPDFNDINEGCGITTNTATLNL